jgi:hypothetical protein
MITFFRLGRILRLVAWDLETNREPERQQVKPVKTQAESNELEIVSNVTPQQKTKFYQVCHIFR